MRRLRTILYTGTFDPFHIGHLEALQFARKSLLFDRLIIAVIRNNPNKPHATYWQHRVVMAQLAIQKAAFDCRVEVKPINYITPVDINNFINRNCKTDELIRLVGSDSIIEFLNRKALWPVLELCHYAILMRKINSQGEMESAISSLPLAIGSKFTYEITGIQEMPYEARKVRQDITKSHEQGLITEDVFKYIENTNLYNISSQ